MRTRILALGLVLALSACSKKDKGDNDTKKSDPSVQEGSAKAPDTKPADPPPADTKPTEPPPVDTKPTEPPPPADPTASWTEHQGPGFVVKGARAPTQEDGTAPTPLGPQPVAMFVGYEPAGFQGSFQTAVADLSAALSAAGAGPVDPKQTVDDSVDGLLKNLPEAKVAKDEPIAGDVVGRAIVASGNHPQGGPFTVHARVYFKDSKLFMVQALHADPKDEALAAAFVASFKFAP